MDFNIIVGGRLLVLTVLIRGINTTWVGVSALNILCQVCMIMTATSTYIIERYIIYGIIHTTCTTSMFHYNYVKYVI